MTTRKEQMELRDKIMAGLELMWKRLLEEKKRNGQELVVMRGDKIVRLKPEDF